MVRAPLLLTLLTLACAHVPKEASPSTGARMGTGPAQAIASYDTTPEPRAARGDAADDDFSALVAEACTGQGLTLDGRLAALAEALARASEGARNAPSYAAVNHEARRAGLVEPTPEVWVASGPSTRALAKSLVDQVRAAAKRRQLTHCGAGAVHEAGGVVIAVALSARFVTLSEPIPQRVERGAELSLKGKLMPGYSAPSLAVTDPDGNVSRQPLGKTRDLDHRLTLDRVGTYSVELLAEGPEGITVVANFPVGVGVDANQKPVASEGPTERTPQEVAARLHEAIAKERKARGLPELKLDVRLADIAHAHCVDMLTNHFIAHTSKTTGEASDRVKRAGLVATVVLENIGRGYSAQEIHQGLMESPGHRGNVLHPDVRELGIGVVAEQEGSRTAFIATELFTRLSREIVLEEVPREVLRAVTTKRKGTNAPKVVLDDKLSRAAQAAAERWANGKERNENALLQRATQEAGAPAKNIRAIAAALVLADDIEQVWESKSLLDPNLRRLGVGVAKLRPTDAHALAVVLLLGLSQ